MLSLQGADCSFRLNISSCWVQPTGYAASTSISEPAVSAAGSLPVACKSVAASASTSEQCHFLLLQWPSCGSCSGRSLASKRSKVFIFSRRLSDSAVPSSCMAHSIWEQEIKSPQELRCFGILGKSQHFRIQQVPGKALPGSWPRQFELLLWHSVKLYSQYLTCFSWLHCTLDSTPVTAIQCAALAKRSACSFSPVAAGLDE